MKLLSGQKIKNNLQDYRLDENTSIKLLIKIYNNKKDVNTRAYFTTATIIIAALIFSL
jgi:hypothetical protein